ncbi:mitochondrial protein Fmp25 [Blastomyces dermatitidis ER-3]|uniref:Mitochondrial protein Fmp25 n=2 Tax=Ajellomyces dermatitidis TaxID=5039 RepID=F2TU00_AJEDA|nr:mitochondrial protein Fmp25 [Blastomyces dermatitidis ER-3]EEQ84345.1 mitochondrial protein Fmp25 [Blastomyces dermatitidis ER-3]EGE86713.1 hypothetical protein BDDG_09663 [Blastomyces dermatitidis ATCC 18188]
MSRVAIPGLHDLHPVIAKPIKPRSSLDGWGSIRKTRIMSFTRGSKRLASQRFSALSKRSPLFAPRLRPYSTAGPLQSQKEPRVPPRIRSYIAVAGLTAVISFGYYYIRDRPGSLGEKSRYLQPELIVQEAKTRQNLSAEENRESLSPQHVQVKRSWERPGLYAWGSNTGLVANPDSNEFVVKTPRRIPYFDGMVLRDVKLDQNFGAAITENGDLIQWGKGYSKTDYKPTKTLKGKNLVSLCISSNRIIALSSGGNVYSLPVSKSDQENGLKPSENSWIPFWRTRAELSYRPLQPQLGLGEKVTAICGGLEHVLLLTTSGRIFSAAIGTEHFPSRGQLGIPGLTWNNRPKGPYDLCHEVSELRGVRITNIAAGDYHSLALDKAGQVFVFGDNASGQLGLQTNVASSSIDTPTMLPLGNLYPADGYEVKASSIAAGGTNSFFTVSAKRILSPMEVRTTVRDLGRVTTDVWSCGKGLFGALGTGKWTHAQDKPTKIKTLSGLFEYSDTAQKVVPIGISRISVGATHAAAVLGNLTNVSASKDGPQTDTNWGSDVFWWGGNEFYQLGTGKRNNVASPTHIRPPADVVPREHQREDSRLQITPRRTVQLDGRTVSLEQRVECGRYVTAVYSGV